MNTSLIPRGGYVAIFDEDGNEVAKMPAAQAEAWMGKQQGGLNMATAGQALQTFGSLLQIHEVRSIRDDVRDSRETLTAKQAALATYLKEKSGAAISGSELSAKLSDVFDAQKKVDKNQNQLFGTVIDQLIVSAAGQGLQLAGSLSSANGAGSGMTGTDLLLAGGAGALLLSAFDDDRRRGRKWNED